jgi:energy-coupling factor transport system substrate-specific component
MKKKIFSVKTLAAIVIGAALMFVLNRFASIPTSVPDTYIIMGIAILSAFAAIFGPIAGFLIGFIGHTLVDLSWGGVWWSWVISSALFGLAIGSCWKMYQIEEGRFGVMQAVIFNGIQIAANALVYVFIARTLDMIMYQEPFGKVSLQGFAAAGFNSAVVLILGTPLIIVYTKIKRKRR